MFRPGIELSFLLALAEFGSKSGEAVLSCASASAKYAKVKPRPSTLSFVHLSVCVVLPMGCIHQIPRAAPGPSALDLSRNWLRHAYEPLMGFRFQGLGLRAPVSCGSRAVVHHGIYYWYLMEARITDI